MFLEVRILKNLAKNDLEMKTKQDDQSSLYAVLPVDYNSTNYSIVNARIIWRGGIDTERPMPAARHSSAFQNGTRTHGADDRGHLQPLGAMNCAPTRDRMWMEDGYTRAHEQQNWI